MGLQALPRSCKSTTGVLFNGTATSFWVLLIHLKHKVGINLDPVALCLLASVWISRNPVGHIGQLGRMNGSCKVCCIPTLSSLNPSDHVRSIDACIYVVELHNGKLSLRMISRQSSFHSILENTFNVNVIRACRPQLLSGIGMSKRLCRHKFNRFHSRCFSQ